MPSVDPLTWFEQKRPWSVYKDLVLAYYLKPYLAKVRRIGSPIAIVDMFAGPGKFQTGEPGSPLIISDSLLRLQETGFPIEAHFIESDPILVRLLRESVGAVPFAHVHHEDCFNLIDQIAEIANRATTFLYVDPLNVAGLYFDKLTRVYEALKANASVEILLVFMATAFMREATSLLAKESSRFPDDVVRQTGFSYLEQVDDDEIVGLEDEDDQSSVELQRQKLERIAGGSYWEAIAGDKVRSFSERCEMLVRGCEERMRSWFKLVASYPIVDENLPQLPKYWLVFGTRYMPAIDLFNRAACKARREQGISWKTEDSLFHGVAVNTTADPSTVDRAVAEFAQSLCPTRWDNLRWAISAEMVGRFTDGEINAGVKRLLLRQHLRGAEGKRVQEDAVLKVP
jgi:three-Cys-motif partner protein